MNEVDKAMDSVEQHDLYGQREVPIAHARVLAAEVRRLRAERDKLRAMLEPTPDALELAMELRAKCYTHSNGGDYSGESSFDIDDAAQLIAAHEARLLDEAAERGLRYYENTDIAHRSGEGLYRAISGHDRAVVRGEGEK